MQPEAARGACSVHIPVIRGPSSDADSTRIWRPQPIWTRGTQLTPLPNLPTSDLVNASKPLYHIFSHSIARPRKHLIRKVVEKEKGTV